MLANIQYHTWILWDVQPYEKLQHAVSHLVSHRTPRLETRARHGTQTSVFIGSFIPWIQERGASFDPQAVQRQEILMKKQKVQGKHICLRFCLIMFVFLTKPIFTESSWDGLCLV